MEQQINERAFDAAILATQQTIDDVAMQLSNDANDVPTSRYDDEVTIFWRLFGYMINDKSMKQ